MPKSFTELYILPDDILNQIRMPTHSWQPAKIPENLHSQILEYQFKCGVPPGLIHNAAVEEPAMIANNLFPQDDLSSSDASFKAFLENLEKERVQPMPACNRVPEDQDSSFPAALNNVKNDNNTQKEKQEPKINGNEPKVGNSSDGESQHGAVRNVKPWQYEPEIPEN